MVFSSLLSFGSNLIERASNYVAYYTTGYHKNFENCSRSDLAARLAGKFLRADENVVFSPASIHFVTGMIAVGASDATLNQTLSFLNFKSKEELVSTYKNILGTTYADGFINGGPRLSFVNGVWLDQSMKLKNPFKEILCGAFKAFAKEADFQKADQVRQEANSWAEKETHGLIKEILPYGSVNAYSRLILANAMHFKGSWIEKFKSVYTKDNDFHTHDGKTVRVPFMKSKERQYVSAFDGFKVLQLPYEQGKDTSRSFSMIVFLPDAKDGLKSLIERMSSESGFLDKYVPVNKVNLGQFMVPKFKMRYKLELSGYLKDMGMSLPFKPGGFTEMVENPKDGKKLRVGKIFHESSVEINEGGTEAASITAACFELVSFIASKTPETDLDFVADHPFLFVIKENKSNDVLFAGTVVNPSATN